MTVQSVVIAVALNLAFVSAARAQNANDEQGQKPPAEQQAPSEQPPAEKPKCVTSKTDWKDGKDKAFVIELQNFCEVRVKCTVEAYVVGSRGPAQGQGTLVLAPKSKGAAAAKAYALKVKSLGGMANVSHSCKEI